MRSLIFVAIAFPAVLAAQTQPGSAMADVRPEIRHRKGTLANGRVTAQFNGRGLASLTAGRTAYRFPKDEFAVTLGGHTYSSTDLGTPARTNEDDRVVFTYAADPYRFDVVYQLRPAGLFVTKTIVVAAAPPGKFKLDEFTVFRDSVADAVRDVRYFIALAPTWAPATMARSCASTSRADCWSPRRIRSWPSSGRATISRWPTSPTWTGISPGVRSRRTAGLLAPYELSGRKRTGEDAARMDAWPDRRDARHGRGRSGRVHRCGARFTALQAGEPAEHHGGLVRQRLPDRYRHTRRTHRVQAHPRHGRHIWARSTCCSRPRIPRSRGAKTAATTGNGSTCCGSGSARRSARTSGIRRTGRFPPACSEMLDYARLEEARAGGLRLPGAGLHAESGVAGGTQTAIAPTWASAACRTG